MLASMKHALAVLLLLTTPAWANMPPERFDKPYPGTLEKHLVPYGKAWAKCDELSRKRGEGSWPKMYRMIDGRHLYGCSMGGVSEGQKRCVIVYSYDPSGADPLMKSNTFRHERGHCLGWNSSHSN